MTLDARERFRKSEFAKTWQDVVDSKQFQEALTAAMVTLSAGTRNNAVQFGPQIQGAWQFIEILCNLTAPIPPTGTASEQNLDHNA